MSKYSEAIDRLECMRGQLGDKVTKAVKSGRYTDKMRDKTKRESEALLTALEALRAAEARENPQPLTVEELRERDGKPVWVETPEAHTAKTGWFIITLVHTLLRDSYKSVLATNGNGHTICLSEFMHIFTAYDFPPNRSHV